MAATSVMVVALAACGGSQPAATPTPAASAGGTAITLRSDAFAAGATLPARFTCDGRGVSPPLTWTGVPAGTAELVLTLRDPDAPQGVYTHWMVYALPPATTALSEGRVPPGALLGRTTRGDIAYAPPCPPRGATHHYVFRLVALRMPSGLAEGATVGEVLAAVAGKVLGSGELVALYRR